MNSKSSRLRNISYLLIFSLALQGIFLLIFSISNPLFRWAEIYIGTCALIYSLAERKSRQRSLYTAIGHILILMIGWIIGGWLGIFFISGILLAVCYYWLYHLAIAILPASNPDDFNESIQRFRLLVWYLWGLQFPVWVVKDHAGRIVEERIPGDAFKNFGLPGMIRTYSNQTVGITAGTQFSRVEGPGVVYTRPYERPYEVIDLRTQIRSTLIEAFSRDGLPYQARLLVVFSIDKEIWKDDEYHALRLKNTLLRGSQKPDRYAGNYRYSRSRVTAALSIEGVKRSFEEKSEHPVIHWDDWVVAIVEEAARKELSTRLLDELWRPAQDEQNMNALDIIAASIKKSISAHLKTNGINLIAARIVNFSFDNKDALKVLRQQIGNWESLMNKDISHTKAQATARSVLLREEAFSYARSALLVSIAQGLDQVTETHNNLPKKYIIAIRFLSAIEDWLRRQPAEGGAAEKLEAFRSRIRDIVPPSQRF